MLSAEAAGELDWAIRQIVACRYVPLTVDARYAYPHVADSVAGDASSTVGWGVRVGPYVAYGRWSEGTLEALSKVDSECREDLSGSSGEVVKLSISPAELFVANLVLRMVDRVAKEKLRGSNRFVARCDNSSACKI